MVEVVASSPACAKACTLLGESHYSARFQGLVLQHFQLTQYCDTSVISKYGQCPKSALLFNVHAWTSATHVGDPDDLPGSWLRPGQLLAIVPICGVNQ